MTDHAALTREEQEFAAEHCGLIDLHLKVNGLDPDKWWDVLVFGYLTAVRCWFRVPQVRRWAFPTIAKVKMRGAMGNQLQYENRAMRRGQAASLDADLDGLEAVTLYDLLPGSSGAEEQAVFEMLMCSLASGLTGTEKAVFRLTTEGYGRGEIARKLGIPHQQVKDTLAVLQHRYAEEQITEAV